MQATQKQLDFELRRWGGARPGAGRKPKPGKRAVPHRRRYPLAARFPVHVTLRVDERLPPLRGRRCIRRIERVLVAACARGGLRVVHYCVQRHHIHLIVEAKSASVLGRGMQGLSIRLAKGLNDLWQRKGAVFVDRYHARILKTPLEVKRAVAYVLLNTRRHEATRARRRHPGWLDPCSSARFFPHFKGLSRPPPLPKPTDPVASPHTWLLNVGAWRHGRIDPDAIPGPASARRRRP